MGRGSLVLLSVLLSVVFGVAGCSRNKPTDAALAPEQAKAPDPAAPEPKQPPAYLAQLKESDVSALIGLRDKPFPEWAGVVVDGKPSPNGLLLHPPANGPASVTYQLGGRYQMFESTVAVNDGADGGAGSATPLVFVVKGDGRELWRSKPVQACKQAQACSVSVAGVDRLTLVVECPGPIHAAFAVWVEPLVK
jgi:hypothetical protein